MTNYFKKVLGLLTIMTVTTSVLSVIEDSPYHTEENKLEDETTLPLQINNLVNLKRTKRNIMNLPPDAHIIVIHNMRRFNIYGSNNGAYKVMQRSNIAQKIPGIEGNVIHGDVTDKFYKQDYNIYLTVKNNDCGYHHYALKDGETTAYKISGLPDDAKLLAIHNLGGVIFFGSNSGAFEVVQGELQASKIPLVSGNVVAIKLRGSARKYDAEFITGENFNKCLYDLELNKLKDKLNKCENKVRKIVKLLEEIQAD